MPRVMAWEPSKATCGACKSKLDDVLVHVRSVRCDVLSSKCSGLWRMLPPKCTFIVVFLAANTICMMGVSISIMQGLYAWFILGVLLIITN